MDRRRVGIRGVDKESMKKKCTKLWIWTLDILAVRRWLMTLTGWWRTSVEDHGRSCRSIGPLKLALMTTVTVVAI
jgi:hypothetical protein